MKLHVLWKTASSTLPGVDGMVTSICCDGKHFYTAVDGGAIRRYAFIFDDLTQTSEDVFTMKQSHISCIDSTRDTTAPNTFLIGCSDGKLHLCSPNWRIEKMVDAHTGGVTCLSVNPDGLSIASGGEDGVVKVWSRNGIL
jgi:intraflagellar transport protein 80